MRIERIQVPSSTHQRNMVFRCRAYNVIFHRISIAKEPYSFVIFQGTACSTPTPSRSANEDRAFHFALIKSCLSGPQIKVHNQFFFISQPKHMLLVLKRTVSKYQKHMFKLMDRKISTILGPNLMFTWRPGSEVIKLFSCSTEREISTAHKN